MSIDWQMVALNIRQHKSLASVSVKMGNNKGWLAQIAREGTEPKFSDGLKLLNIHLDLVGVDKHKKLVKM